MNQVTKLETVANADNATFHIVATHTDGHQTWFGKGDMTAQGVKRQMSVYSKRFGLELNKDEGVAVLPIVETESEEMVIAAPEDFFVGSELFSNDGSSFVISAPTHNPRIWEARTRGGVKCVFTSEAECYRVKKPKSFEIKQVFTTHHKVIVEGQTVGRIIDGMYGQEDGVYSVVSEKTPIQIPMLKSGTLGECKEYATKAFGKVR